MSLFSAIAGIFGGSSNTLEKIATEWIETDLEKAEAKTIMLKTLDPNGKMRRDLSSRVAGLYTLYLVTTLILVTLEAFNIGPMNGDSLAVSVATGKITELFMPITGLFGAIVTASFGVNYANVKGDK